MMCEDDIDLTSAGEGKARVAQWRFRGASLHPAFQIIAVSGEVTLHGEHLYLQICQPATGADSGILIRTCQGRKDYTGGRNNFLPLSWLDQTEALAGYCQRILDREGGRP